MLREYRQSMDFQTPSSTRYCEKEGCPLGQLQQRKMWTGEKRLEWLRTTRPPEGPKRELGND
jgi:hypothetical protein